jgi:hypothetical protein
VDYLLLVSGHSMGRVVGCQAIDMGDSRDDVEGVVTGDEWNVC